MTLLGVLQIGTQSHGYREPNVFKTLGLVQIHKNYLKIKVLRMKYLYLGIIELDNDEQIDEDNFL